MEVKIVLGHTFGDEGKGVTVQWLCKKAIEEGKKPLVVRFSGGPQAAHTIFNGGTEHICSSFGSGVLLGVPTTYTRDVYVDPICMMNELHSLKEKGINPILYMGAQRVITPYDVLVGRESDKVRKDGTCGKGIYATFNRYNKCKGPFEKLLLSKYNCTQPGKFLTNARKFYGVEPIEEYEEMFRSACLELSTEVQFIPDMKEYDVLIFEGTQGLLLDMDRGFYPNVTPSMVGLNALTKYEHYEDYLRGAEVYLVTRTYTTRHGNGYTPKIECPFDLSKKHETNINNEFQGEFKTGALEVSLLNTAYMRHCIDNDVKKYNLSLNLVITHMDVIDGKFEIVEGNAVVGGNIDCGRVFDIISKRLCYKPKHVYYNDSVESNIKQLR